jgi:hypothetical protein
VLLSEFEPIVERNGQRAGEQRLRPDLLRTIYEMMLPWRERRDVPIIDNTSLTIAETAQALDHIVARSSSESGGIE